MGESPVSFPEAPSIVSSSLSVEEQYLLTIEEVPTVVAMVVIMIILIVMILKI